MAGLGDLVLLMESTCLIEQIARENLVHETLLLPILSWMNLVGVMLETGLRYSAPRSHPGPADFTWSVVCEVFLVQRGQRMYLLALQMPWIRQTP